MGCSTCRRLKARSCRVSEAARLAARLISSTSDRCGSPWARSPRSRSLMPRIAVSRLLKSWAIPPASRPAVSILRAWRNCSSSTLRSVMSRWVPQTRTSFPSSMMPTQLLMKYLVRPSRSLSTDSLSIARNPLSTHAVRYSMVRGSSAGCTSVTRMPIISSGCSYPYMRANALLHSATYARSISRRTVVSTGRPRGIGSVNSARQTPSLACSTNARYRSSLCRSSHSAARRSVMSVKEVTAA